MSDYSVSEAKDSFPQLIREAEAGQEIRVTRRGLPVAFLVSAQRYSELTSGHTSFSERYRSFRKRFADEPMDLDVDELLAKGHDQGSEVRAP